MGCETNGIVVGIVEDLNDTEGMARVRVKYGHLGEQISEWAKIASPMAGGGRGFYFRPERKDEVLVAFEHGEPRRPYIIGSLWSKVDKPPKDDGDIKANNWRFIQSRCGHIIKLDDTKGKEKIEILDKDKKRRVIIDSAQKKIQVICEEGDVEVTASAGKVKVQAVTVEVKASADMNLEAGGTMTIKGATVNIN